MYWNHTLIKAQRNSEYCLSYSLHIFRRCRMRAFNARESGKSENFFNVSKSLAC